MVMLKFAYRSVGTPDLLQNDKQRDSSPRSPAWKVEHYRLMGSLLLYRSMAIFPFESTTSIDD
jgi:hypothetical protein